VRKLQHMPAKQVLEVHVDLPGEAFIPATFVPDMRLKIDLYRRLARVSAADELADLTAEIIDRFGPWPAPVGRLIEQAELRIAAAGWQIDAIRREEGFVVFDYRNPGRIAELARLKPGRVRIVDGRSAYVPLEKGVVDWDFERLAAIAKAVLQAA
jgi:transcription-repair coupling factor (superfamily II helicase)